MSLKNLLSMMSGRKTELKGQLRLIELVISMLMQNELKDHKALLCALCLIRHDIVDSSCPTTSRDDPVEAYNYYMGVIRKSVRLLTEPGNLDYGKRVDNHGNGDL